MGNQNKNNRTNRTLLDNQRNQSNTNYNQFQGGIDLNASRNSANEQSNEIRSRYGRDNNNFMTPGLTPGSNGYFDTSGMPGGGDAERAAGGDFASAKGGYQKFADTGGRENYADAEGSYKNFINNGGIGDSEAQAIRNRATDQIPAFYDAYKRSAQRRSNVQGGYSPGFDAQQAELGRQAGREGFNASRQVEGDIADKRQQGRMFGTSGMAGIGRDVSGNQLSGLGGLTNIGGLEQQNNQFNAGLGEQGKDRQQRMQQFLLDQYQRGGMESARGLQTHYASAPGALGQDQDAWLNAQRGRDSNSLGNLGIRSGIQDKNFMDQLSQFLGGAGGFIGGLGGSRQSPKPTDDNFYALPSYGGNTGVGGPQSAPYGGLGW